MEQAINYLDTNLLSDNIVQFPIPAKHTHTQERISPLRDPNIVNKVFEALLNSGRYSLRNATIFALQLAIGRRTNDILSMRLSTVYDFSHNRVKSLITIDEHKTGKTARDLPISSKTISLLESYIKTLKRCTPNSYLFPSQKHNPDGSQRPLNTNSLNNLYTTVTSTICKELNYERSHITTYAARKTYGYNLYMECLNNNNGFLPGTDINALQYVQSVFNHNSTMTTLRYIGAYDAPAAQLAEDIQSKYDF